ncbi:MAG TPA: methyltransferase domain-containing protein [Steroidobacteraceae bacterium]|nr:methyltransferase domain-containing protein [Steroidobacteraceae bacterium]
MSVEDSPARLEETRDAFDSVAADYDGPRGNNDLIQDMRTEMWRWMDASFAPGSRLIDIGCGTGLDAVRMARAGHRVTATDWSSQMVARVMARAEAESVADRVSAVALGAQELGRLEGAGSYDGAYSDLGPLNCVPDLRGVSTACAQLLRPGGMLVFTVIGRLCPWEIAHYLGRRRGSRAMVRFARGVVPVGMNRHTIWTRYYTPRELYREFEPEFSLRHYRGLCVFAPPPYLAGVRARHRRLYEALWRLDRRTAGWPLLRSIGDHFLIVMTRR